MGSCLVENKSQLRKKLISASRHLRWIILDQPIPSHKESVKLPKKQINIPKKNLHNQSQKETPFAPIIQNQKDPTPLKNTKNLDSLKLSVHNCQDCNLAFTRKTLVFGQGNSAAKIVFVGEAPGAEEDHSGLPFVGKAGKLLTQIILSMGITRESVYICNIIKCRPPENRNPSAEEIQQCLPILIHQLNLLQPKLIVTLGNIAIKSLIPNSLGITRMRGKLQNFKGIPLYPTYHPSYLLRNPQALNETWYDVRMIRKLLFSK